MGRLSEAIDDIRAAEDEYLALGRHDLVHIARADLAEVLLSANLLEEAADVADRAVAGVRVHGTDTDVADASLLAARCRLAVGRSDDALDAARESVALLERQQRSSLLAVAEYVAMSVGDGTAAPSEVAAALDELAGRLRDHGWWLETTGARVLAAAAWLRAGDTPAATATLGLARPDPAAAGGRAGGRLAGPRHDRRGRRRPPHGAALDHRRAAHRVREPGQRGQLRAAGLRRRPRRGAATARGDVWRSPTAGPVSCSCGSRRPAAG